MNVQANDIEKYVASLPSSIQTSIRTDLDKIKNIEAKLYSELDGSERKQLVKNLLLLQKSIYDTLDQKEIPYDKTIISTLLQKFKESKIDNDDAPKDEEFQKYKNEMARLTEVGQSFVYDVEMPENDKEYKINFGNITYSEVPGICEQLYEKISTYNISKFEYWMQSRDVTDFPDILKEAKEYLTTLKQLFALSTMVYRRNQFDIYTNKVQGRIEPLDFPETSHGYKRFWKDEDIYGLFKEYLVKLHPLVLGQKEFIQNLNNAIKLLEGISVYHMDQ